MNRQIGKQTSKEAQVDCPRVAGNRPVVRRRGVVRGRRGGHVHVRERVRPVRLSASISGGRPMIVMEDDRNRRMWKENCVDGNGRPRRDAAGIAICASAILKSGRATQAHTKRGSPCFGLGLENAWSCVGG